MRLQSHYNKVTVASTLVVLLVAAASYYFLLRYVLINQLDEALKVEEVEIQEHIKKYDKLPEASTYKDQRIAFEKTDSFHDRRFKSLTAFHPGENEMEFSRQLVFTVSLNGDQYLVSVTKSEESTEDLVWIILLSTIALLILLTVILFFTNRFLLKKLWKPFHSTLSTIKGFNLSAPVDISMPATNITEFKELNETIRMMAKKVMTDYQSLKNFTDHASHEMQTPLAIINSKLDILIQEPELSEKSMLQIQGIYNAVEKLARLSQSLLLLAKIENKQFVGTERILINAVIGEKIIEMQDWIDSAGLTIKVEESQLTAAMHKELAGILVSNLLRNAIFHCTSNGTIHVQTDSNKLLISNSGNVPLDDNQIFDRFYKSDISAGNGLGLAIAKQICEQYGYHLQYSFAHRLHQFGVEFRT